MRSSRSSRWASANWIRSCGVSGGLSPAWSRRYWFTQLPSVPSFTPSSRATWAIGRDPSITNRTASSRNSGLNLRYFLAIPCITFRARSYWIRVREQRGTSTIVVDLGGLEFLAVRGVSVLLAAKLAAEEAGRDLQVMNAHGLPARVLRLWGFESWCQQANTVR